MNLSHECADEFLVLLHAVAEGNITAEQASRLDAILRTDTDAVAYYTAFMHQQAELAYHFGTARAPLVLSPTAGSPPPPGGPRNRSPRFRYIATLGAIAAAVALVLTFMPKAGPLGEAMAAEPTDSSIALLSQVASPEWDGPRTALRAGAPLLPGRIRLRSGLAQLQFYSGATLSFEGPAELELLSIDKVRCLQGKFRARVPSPAARFIVETPNVLALEPGSDVGIDGTAVGSIEIHVFQGTANLSGPLVAGQGVRLKTASLIERLEAAPERFSRLDQLAALSRDERARRHQDWLQVDHRLADDPTLLAHYDFEDPAAGTLSLRNVAHPGSGDGAVIGCSWVEGRWSGKHALEFKRVGDRVRLDLPSEFASLTLVAWLRVDALPHRLNAVLMSDRFPEGAIHWQISSAGAIVLGVQDPTKLNGASYTSPNIFTAGRLGQWAQLAVVYDQGTRQVTHYVDGRPVSRHPLKFDVLLRLGPSELGNWAPNGFADPRPIRNFIGRMDELLIFSHPLTEAEITRLFDQGHP